MKTLITFLLAILIICQVGLAKVRTVSNNLEGGAQYTTLQAAHDASSNDDTILVSGSNTVYGMGFWSKKLVVIGEGFNTQKENFKTTKFGKGSSGAGSGGSWSFASGGNGSKFYGIHFINECTTCTYANGLFCGTNNLFENCLMERWVIAGNNVQYTNCIFLQAMLLHGTLIGVRFANCIFNAYLEGNTSVAQNTEVNHCLFLSQGTLFGSLVGLTFKNNIFVNSSNFSGITGATFKNNICRLSATFPPAGNTNGGGNQVGVDPLFVSYTFGSLYFASNDLDLQPGSPAIGAADDLTDIGIHGGYSHFSEYGEPLIAPVVRSVNIINPIVVPGGTMNVRVQASKPNDN
jgi:hypothetical protein